MLPLDRNGYPANLVTKELHSARRELTFRYELLDKAGNKKADLADVVGGVVRHSAQAQTKRTAQLKLRDTGQIDFLSDRIKVYCWLHMPDGGFASFPLGVFLLPTSPRKIGAGFITREVEAYDMGRILQEDVYEDRYTALAGANAVDAVKGVLQSAGISSINIPSGNQTLPGDRDWWPGTPKARIVDDLLALINYRPLVFDGDGWAVSAPYVSPDQRASEYTYRNDNTSVLWPEAEQTLDLADVPNKWLLVNSSPDYTTMLAAYTNSNPNSPTSTVSRGRTIARVEQVEAADQATLDAKAQRYAFEASQVFEHVRFDTAIMPMHDHWDVLTLDYSRLGPAAKYVETGWELPLQPGARMAHEARRVVQI